MPISSFNLRTPLARTLVVVLAVAGTVAPAFAQSAGDPANGQKVSKRCMACHNFDNDKAKVGPSLQGVYGRAAGSMPGYAYSKAMQAKAAEIGTWDDAKLDAYLTNPSAYLGGQSKMTFKLSKPQDRLDMIAYLKSLAKP